MEKLNQPTTTLNTHHQVLNQIMTQNNDHDMSQQNNQDLAQQVPEPTIVAEINAQEVDLENFDPDTIDWDAINAAWADGTMPDFGVYNDALFPGVQLQEKNAAQLQDENELGALAENEEKEDIVYDIFTNLPKIDLRPPHDWAAAPLTSPVEFWKQDLDLAVTFEPQLGNAIESTFDDNSQFDILAPNYMSIGMYHQYQNADVAVPKFTASAASLKLSDAATGRENSASVPQHVVNPKKRALEHYLNENLDVPNAKRHQFAHEVPQWHPSNGYAPAQQSPPHVTAQVSQQVLQPLVIPHMQRQAAAPALPPAVPLLPAVPGLQFANGTQAQRAAATRTFQHNWQPPQNDATIPRSAAQRGLYVIKLKTSFMDISQCIDSADVDSFKDRWESLQTGTSIYTEAQIETVCWHLLAITEALHTRGPVSFNIFDPSKMANVYKSRRLTFAARVNQICELLSLSKACCEKLLKFTNLQMVVATPIQLFWQCKSNKKQNATRQDTLVAGRQALKDNSAVRQDGNGEFEDTSHDIQLDSLGPMPQHGLNAIAATPAQAPAQAPGGMTIGSFVYPPGYGHFPGQITAGRPSMHSDGSPPHMRARQPSLMSGRTIPLTNDAAAANQILQPSVVARGQQDLSGTFEDNCFPVFSTSKRQE